MPSSARIQHGVPLVMDSLLRDAARVSRGGGKQVDVTSMSPQDAYYEGLSRGLQEAYDRLGLVVGSKEQERA